jgi:predicted AAA+ superfamily ATPase
MRRRLAYKYYCIDTGLRGVASASRTGDIGRLVENVVCVELLRRGETPEYWRGRHEIDFIVGPWPGTITPMNVCYSDEIPRREYEGLGEFKGPKVGSVAKPIILTRTKEGEEDGVDHVPVWKWLQEGKADVRARLPYPPTW